MNTIGKGIISNVPCLGILKTNKKIMAAKHNYIINGDGDSINNWIVTHGILEVVSGIVSEKQFKITNSDTIACMSQQVIIPAGTYRIKFVQFNGLASGRVTISNSIYDYGGTIAIDPINAMPIDQEFAIVYDNPIINLWVNSVTSGDFCYYDEIKIEAA
jgi:hypothetical protein